MADEVSYIDPSHNPLPKIHWQMLSQLKLEAVSHPNGTIKAWLLNTLRDFSLPDDLVSRLLTSIEDATARVLSPDIAEGQFDFLDIVMLVPSMQTPQGHTWGFFRVERPSTDALNESVKGHCVEYYLYYDKKTGE